MSRTSLVVKDTVCAEEPLNNLVQKETGAEDLNHCSKIQIRPILGAWLKLNAH